MQQIQYKGYEAIADYKKLFSLFNQYNTRVIASMIIGLGGETKETLDDMLQQLIRLKVSYGQFYLLMLLPGTELRKQFIRENRIKDHNWDHQDGTVFPSNQSFFKVKNFKIIIGNCIKNFILIHP